MQTREYPFRLNVEKAVQATGVILRACESNCHNYMKLLKLLYIADRESIKEIGRPITGDKVVAMKRGPVLSGIYNLIKGEWGDLAAWQAHYATSDAYEIHLVGEHPGIGSLSRYEVKKLHEVTRRYAAKDEFDMVGIVHEFPEWIKNNPGDSSVAISLSDILEGLGIQERESDIRAVAEEEETVAKFFKHPSRQAVHERCSVG